MDAFWLFSNEHCHRCGSFIMSSEMKSKHNSFLRLFPSHPVLEGNSFDLKVNSYYLAEVQLIISTLVIIRRLFIC